MLWSVDILRDNRDEISRSLIFCSELQLFLSNSNSKYNTSEMLWVFIATPSQPPAIHTHEHVHTLTLLTLTLKSFNHFSNWAVHTSAPGYKGWRDLRSSQVGPPRTAIIVFHCRASHPLPYDSQESHCFLMPHLNEVQED